MSCKSLWNVEQNRDNNADSDTNTRFLEDLILTWMYDCKVPDEEGESQSVGVDEVDLVRIEVVPF